MKKQLINTSLWLFGLFNLFGFFYQLFGCYELMLVFGLPFAIALIVGWLFIRKELK